MTPAEYIAAANLAMQLFVTLYNAASQIKGNVKIPTAEEILAKNLALQAKIDAEK